MGLYFLGWSSAGTCARYDTGCWLWGEQPCSYQGEYCPEGTINEYSYVDASHFPPGKICKTTNTIEDCKAG